MQPNALPISLLLGKETPARGLASAPEELTRQPLRRLGEGIGKVVYASEHWVVKRERTTSEIVALIVIWRLLLRLKHILPPSWSERFLRHPSKRIRMLRVIMQSIVLVIPRAVWFSSHIGDIWRLYRSRDLRGERLARAKLTGTGIVPDHVTFPPARVQVGGWPGWLRVCEATERVEATLDERVTRLARSGRFDEVELWLDRFLDLRQSGWQRGLFSVDAHLKNFGVTGDRVVLLDAGGLTENWEEIETRLSFEQKVTEPHVQMGLQQLLQPRPDIAARFNRRWKATVNREQVQQLWPTDPAY